MAPGSEAVGCVAGLFRRRADGGEPSLPKVPVPEIDVEFGGVAGDFNRYRHENLHDDPDSALLIMPEETLGTLRAEGWPVQPGDFGENISSRGIEYDRFRPGAIVALGAVRAQITRPCDPCANLYRLPYVGDRRGPEFLRTVLHRRGWYAVVSSPGRVRIGDRVEIL